MHLGLLVLSFQVCYLYILYLFVVFLIFKLTNKSKDIEVKDTLMEDFINQDIIWI